MRLSDLRCDDAEFFELLGKTHGSGFYLSADLDPDLARTREAADRAQNDYDAARSAFERRVAAQLGRDRIESSEFIVMRDAVASPPSGVHVISEAATYYLCEIELDESGIEALRRRDRAVEAVWAAEDRARAKLCEKIRARIASKAAP